MTLTITKDTILGSHTLLRSVRVEPVIPINGPPDDYGRPYRSLGDTLWFEAFSRNLTEPGLGGDADKPASPSASDTAPGSPTSTLHKGVDIGDVYAPSGEIQIAGSNDPGQLINLQEPGNALLSVGPAPHSLAVNPQKCGEGEGPQTPNKAAGARESGAKWGGEISGPVKPVCQSCPPRCSTARRSLSLSIGSKYNPPVAGESTAAEDRIGEQQAVKPRHFCNQSTTLTPTASSGAAGAGVDKRI